MAEYRNELAATTSATLGNGHIITRADDLRAAWERRDRRYAARPQSLAPEEVAAIRIQRAYEAGFVEPMKRGPLFVRARHWSPPKLGAWA